MEMTTCPLGNLTSPTSINISVKAQKSPVRVGKCPGRFTSPSGLVTHRWASGL